MLQTRSGAHDKIAVFPAKFLQKRSGLHPHIRQKAGKTARSQRRIDDHRNAVVVSRRTIHGGAAARAFADRHITLGQIKELISGVIFKPPLPAVCDFQHACRVRGRIGVCLYVRILITQPYPRKYGLFCDRQLAFLILHPVSNTIFIFKKESGILIAGAFA